MNHRFAIALVGTAAVLLAAESVVAQSPPVDEIAIVAPHEITHKEVGHGSLGLPLEQVTLTHKVGYKDLDLKSEAGAAALEQRINDVAKHACDELDKLYPKAWSENRRCEMRARDSAKDQMEAVLAAAKNR